MESEQQSIQDGSDHSPPHPIDEEKAASPDAEEDVRALTGVKVSACCFVVAPKRLALIFESGFSSLAVL